MESRLVFIDLETAGPSPQRHPIIQVAAVATDESLVILEAFEAKIAFDEARANRNSLRKNHFHRGRWAKQAVNPKAAGHAFAEFLRRHATIELTSGRGEPYRVAQLVAHNAAFDAPFIQAWFDRLRIYLPAQRLVLCTMQRAMWHFAERPDSAGPYNFKLATLCRHFGVPFHAADAHEALGDALATLKLYQALLMASTISQEARVPLPHHIRI